MNENEFEFDGKTYVSVAIGGFSCDGCQLFNDGCSIAYGDYPCCSAKGRLDGRAVIFVEKQQ